MQGNCLLDHFNLLGSTNIYRLRQSPSNLVPFIRWNLIQVNLLDLTLKILDLDNGLLDLSLAREALTPIEEVLDQEHAFLG